MPDERFEEAMEQRLSKIVDEKMELVRHSLLSLKKTQDETIAQLNGELLRTQRFLAEVSITTNFNQCYKLMRDQKGEMAKRHHSQLVASASAATTKVQQSDDPLSIAGEFIDKCRETLKHLGIQFVQLD